MSKEKTLRVAVLLSGSGRTLENFLRQIDAGLLPAQIVAVASNRDDVRGIDIAAKAGLAHASFRRADFESRVARDRAMFAWLGEFQPDLFCLAGYLALLDLAGSGGRPVLNIHPALLPKYGGKGFYGDHVHRAVLESGDSTSGATVHLVDVAYDRGPILAQTEVAVEAGDDVRRLADRVFAAECELYPRVLRQIAEGTLRLGA
jgi:formyltetrahydrofolate-dependent phosphoribosylglycinamide formyltransferase